jgi:cobalt-zinc-cadmium efflux system membrane fusion protein
MISDLGVSKNEKQTDKKEPSKKNETFRKAGFFLAGIVVAFILFKFFDKKPQPTIVDFKGSNKEKFTCRTDTAKLAPLETDILFNGTVSFDENNVIRVFPVVSGTVENVEVSLGTLVKKGQVLAKIKSADVSTIQNDYRVAQANFELAKKNLKVAEELYKSSFASETDLITAKKEYEKAENNLLKAKEITNLYGANTDQPFYVVHSPIDGFIVEKNINENIQLRPDNSTPMFTISDLKKVWVWVNVYEADIAQVKEGQNVVITTMVYPGKEFKGKITNVGNVLDKESRVLKVRVELNNKDGLLKPDMFATIKLHIGQPRMMLAVNPKSLVFDNDEYYVIVENKGQYEVRQVKLALNTSQYAYLASGVKVGEIVVTEGNLLVYNELLSK